MYMTLLLDLIKATGQTLYMVMFSTFFATLLGLPLGILVFCTESLKPAPRLRSFLNALINGMRSIPFIILLVAIIPFTRLLVGTSIGMNAALVPLTIGAIPFYARLVDNSLRNINKGLLDTGFSMGASTWQLIRHLLIPEALPSLIQGITVMAISLVNFSAMAGTVGGGGLGDLAIRYGYQRFDMRVMVSTVLILIVLVQGLQYVGDKLAQRYKR